jgi:Fur family transcriptional regulator, peroxide stress response regulator
MNLEGHPANNLEDNPLIDGLRASGAKITAQRIAICNWLLNTNTHPTATAVYEAIRDDFPTMSLATVYNTLSLLEGLGLLHQVARADDGSVRYDQATTPHINLVCTRCGQITDLHHLDLSPLARSSATLGFHIQNLNLTAYGLCADCLAELESGEK